MQHDGEGVQIQFEKSATLWDGEKGLLGAPKMGFMRIRNESTPMMISVEVSTESIYQSDGSWRVGLSNTKLVGRNAQSCIGTSGPVLTA
jgi:hypothetical protein